MKVRRRLVSNSSTCSFVLIGFSIPRDSVDREALEEELGKISSENLRVRDHEELGAPAGKTLVGFDYETDEYEVESVDWVSLEDTIKELRIVKDVLPASSSEIRIYFGTTMC